MGVWTGMEIDYLSPEWGPHIDYFQRMPLDYRIGSVHFVPNQDGIPVDCDGSFARFSKNLKDAYAGDLRYVVERYFEQVLRMLELGGFGILGHADKIAANASEADPGIEMQGWYAALMEDVAEYAGKSGVIVEINTKAILDRKRFFPELRWWHLFMEKGCRLMINSDAHYPDKITLGRAEALEELEKQRKSKVAAEQ